MHTFRYKGWFIHDNFNAGKVQIQNPETFEVFPARSVRAAKCAISRRV